MNFIKKHFPIKPEFDTSPEHMQARNHLAIWAITPNGAHLAAKIAKEFPEAHLFLSDSLDNSKRASFTFTRLSEAVASAFHQYQGHIFIMSTGIVVRLIAQHIRDKTVDPAVVVIDEKGHHAISLLSGHIGGANALTQAVAKCIGAAPVITTATDVNNVPAIDVLAKENNLFIENPDAIKYVNMALLTDKIVYLHDPFGIVPPYPNFLKGDRGNCSSSVFIDDVRVDLPPQVLILRPRTLVAGMGCNRNTSMEEMKIFLNEMMIAFNLSIASLKCIATITLKKDEPGLIALAAHLNLPIIFFTAEELGQVENIETPSEMVEKHIGVKSVCEAAAIIGSNRGKLIVPKHSTRNVTVAIARTASIL